MAVNNVEDEDEEDRLDEVSMIGSCGSSSRSYRWISSNSNLLLRLGAGFQMSHGWAYIAFTALFAKDAFLGATFFL